MTFTWELKYPKDENEEPYYVIKENGDRKVAGWYEWQMIQEIESLRKRITELEEKGIVYNVPTC